MAKPITLLLSAILPVMLAIAPHVHANRGAAGDLDMGVQSFNAQAAQIRADLAGSDKYSEISDEDRRTVLSLLARIESVLGPEGRAEGLSTQATVDIFNDQEQINGILTNARADSRVICRREQVTGSHRKQHVCMTSAERRRQSAADREDLSNFRQMRTDPGKPAEP